MLIHEEFNCLGYYGFGSGVDLSRRTSAGKRVQGQMYCGMCPLGGNCWNKHRDRIRRLVPELMKLMDEIVATGTLGQDLLREYQRRILESDPGRDPSKIVPPDIMAMGGNIQDGARVASGLQPEERGPFTLRLPFES